MDHLDVIDMEMDLLKKIVNLDHKALRGRWTKEKAYRRKRKDKLAYSGVLPEEFLEIKEAQEGVGHELLRAKIADELKLTESLLDKMMTLGQLRRKVFREVVFACLSKKARNIWDSEESHCMKIESDGSVTIHRI